METVTLALGVATLVVIVLLMSCWDNKPRRKASRGNRSRAVAARGVDADYSHQISSWGSGVKNRQLNQQYNELADLSGYEDYSNVIKYQALDPEVFESHESYGDQIGVANNGASNLAVRSDPNDVVPWMGLRRPDYHSIYAGADSRVEHSEYADQMFPRTTYGGC